MTTLALRDYQTDCIDAVFGELRTTQRSVVVLPTGSGKTVIFSHLAVQWQESHYGKDARVLIVVHRDELVRQTVAKLHAITGQNVGIVQADLNNYRPRIVVASVQSLIQPQRLRAYRDAMTGPLLIIVDEAHHAVAPSYQTIVRELSGFSGSDRTKVVGFTATLMRSDDLRLGNVWQSIAYQRSIKWMIERGWLVDVRGKSVPVDDLDLNTVKRTAGELQAGDLGDAMLASMALETVATAYLEQAGDRLGVAFWPTVETAEQACETFDNGGITSAVVTGTTPHDVRQKIYTEQAHGRLQVVHNCMVLTEGWDSPPVSCAVIGRPTSSTGLYIQMVGRVLRPWPAGGKKDALVLDVTGAARTHSLATLGALVATEDKPSRELDDGESLLEFELAEAGLRDDIERKVLIKSHMVDIDLFAQSRSAWLQTDRGVWFINIAAGYFFLFEERDDSGYVVGFAPKTGKAQRLTEPLTLDMAISVGESKAMDMDPSLASKTASWRRRKAPATEKQLAVLRLPPETEMTKQEASNMISMMFASRQLKWAAR